MRILFLGDLVGRAGREAAIKALPDLRQRFSVDFTIVNAENAAAGYGLTKKIATALFDVGADVLTLGNHAFDQKDIASTLVSEPRILKPVNWPRTPGAGVGVFQVQSGPAMGKKVMVSNVLGRIFMNPVDDPFSAVDAMLREHTLGRSVDAAVIDFHAEATSEKMAMGHWCDGRASLVVGTHTHVPTADARILDRGTAYLTDAGMCGVYDSVIGMDKIEPIKRFITGLSQRPSPATGAATVCGVLVVTDDATGLAVEMRTIRESGGLAEPTEAAPGWATDQRPPS